MRERGRPAATACGVRLGARPAAALAAALAALLAGCGAGGNPRSIGRARVPLAPGAQVVAHARSCDRGANAYCSIQLVVVGPGYASSAALMSGEQAHLRSLGWSGSQGETGHQSGAESPGNELRIDYATAFEDLLAIDEGWIRRRPEIAQALSAAVFDRRPAISIMLVRGAS